MAFQVGLLSFTVLIWFISRRFNFKRSSSFWSATLFATSIMFILVGFSHLTHPERILFMIDNFLPYPQELVLISGLAEILLGIGLLLRKTRNWSALLLICQLCLMFPANVNVAINGLSASGDSHIPDWYNWSRLLFQPVYIFWILKATILNVRSTSIPNEDVAVFKKKTIESK